MTRAIDSTYIAKTTVPAALPKNAVATSTYTVSRALQVTNGISSPVSRRCRRSDRMRVPARAGTLQPKPTINGRKARPGRPMSRMSRSTTNAARAR